GQIGRMAVSVKRWVRISGRRFRDRLCDGGGIGPGEAVPARFDGLDPLGVLAQRYAGPPVPVGLVLDAAGVGEDDARLRRERGEVEVAGRRPGVDVPSEPKA